MAHVEAVPNDTRPSDGPLYAIVLTMDEALAVASLCAIVGHVGNVPLPQTWRAHTQEIYQKLERAGVDGVPAVHYRFRVEADQWSSVGGRIMGLPLPSWAGRIAEASVANSEMDEKDGRPEQYRAVVP